MADILDTTQQIVLSVRIKGDATGPQTGDVVLGANILTDWVETESYDQYEMVVQDGNIYRAMIGSTGKLPSDNPDYWEPMTDIACKIHDWAAQTKYKEDTVIYHDGHLYRAPADMVSGDEFDYSEYEEIDSVNTILTTFTEGSHYSKNEMVTYGGKLYRAKNECVPSSWDIADWEIISETTVPDFAPNTTYEKDQVVLAGNRLYRAKYDFTSGTGFDGNDWDAVQALGVTGFTSNTYYPRGSVIYVNGKMYYANNDFTSSATFNPNDWTAVSDTILDTFTAGTHYQKGKMVYYNGDMYYAKYEFDSDSTFNRDDWILITGSTVPGFENYTFYLAGQIIYHNGLLYRANNEFTSGGSFDPADWTEISETMQETYTRWNNTGTNVSLPTYNSNITNSANTDYAIQNSVQPDNSRIAITGTDSTVELEASADSANVAISNTQGRTELTPTTISAENDTGDEYFTVDVENGEMTMSDNIAKSFADTLPIMSTTQKGVAMSDGDSTRVEDEVLSAYAIARTFEMNHEYSQCELINYNGELYFAKASFTSGSAFNIGDWTSASEIIGQYTTGMSYSVGDIIRDTNNYLYYCNTAISSAPATQNSGHWTPIKIMAENVVLDTSGMLVAQQTSLQGSIALLDSKAYYAVQPYDGSTNYLLTTATAGSSAPAAVAGKTTICIFTE